MPKLIKGVEAKIFDNIVSELKLITSLSAEIQTEDYININAFIAYLQNFKKIDNYEILEKPLTFGLKNQYNLPTTILEISY